MIRNPQQQAIMLLPYQKHLLKSRQSKHDRTFLNLESLLNISVIHALSMRQEESTKFSCTGLLWLFIITCIKQLKRRMLPFATCCVTPPSTCILTSYLVISSSSSGLPFAAACRLLTLGHGVCSAHRPAGLQSW